MQYVNKLLSLSLHFAISSPMINTLEQANKIIEQQHTQIEELSRQLHSSERKVTMLQHQVEQSDQLAEADKFVQVHHQNQGLFVGHPQGAVHIPWIDEPDWIVNPLFVTLVF